MSTYSTHPAIIKAKQQAAAAASKKMSITQTFFLAHKARGKLSSEAQKSDHDLRLLVLHANFLDQLMLNLSQVEQEEDAWFNNMVRGNSADDEVDHKISAFETIQEEEPEIGWLAEDYSDSESSEEEDDDESDFEDDDEEDALELRTTITDFTIFPPSLSQKPSRIQQIVSTAVEVDPDYDSDEAIEDDENEDGFYALERTQSHRPPSLVEDLSDSDEEYNPPSPPQPAHAVPVISEKQRKQLVTTSFYDDGADSLMDPEIYLQRQSSSLIEAY